MRWLNGRWRIGQVCLLVTFWWLHAPVCKYGSALRLQEGLCFNNTLVETNLPGRGCAGNSGYISANFFDFLCYTYASLSPSLSVFLSLSLCLCLSLSLSPSLPLPPPSLSLKRNSLGMLIIITINVTRTLRWTHASVSMAWECSRVIKRGLNEDRWEIGQIRW